MKIAVRLDDITSTMDWERFERLEGLLDRYGIVPLLGVVPDNQDENLKRGTPHPEFGMKLKSWQQKGWILAMHGWRHLYTTQKGGLFPLNHFGEFAGVAPNKQREMVRDGRKKLQEMGIETKIFMAPGHSYDRWTIEALKEEGFRFITDGFGSEPYFWRGITFLPIAVQRNKDIQKPAGYTTLVFHPNSMNEADFAEAEKIFGQYQESFIGYGEYLKVTPVRRGILGRMGEYLLASLKHWIVKLKGSR